MADFSAKKIQRSAIELMVKGKTILALITARGGSKGIPQKNIADLGGKPLIAWTIEAAKKSAHIDRLVLSSDDPEIIRVAKQLGCEVPFVRPAELALDNTPSMDVILHALDSLGTQYDYLLLLQPTSPFRTAQHIHEAIEFLFKTSADSVVSISPVKKGPELIFYASADGSLTPVVEGLHATRRQDSKPAFEYNGAIYLSHVPYLRKKRSYKTPETRGIELSNFIDVDIDEPKDLAYARYIVEKNLHL